MPIIPPGYMDASVQMVHEALSRPSFITLGCKLDTAETEPDDLAELVRDAFVGSGSLIAKLDTGVTVGPITVRVGQDGAEPLVGATDVTNAGTGVSNGVAVHTAALIHKRTARGGRRGRGRIFMPWCLEDTDVNEAGTLTTGARSGLQAVWDAFALMLVSNAIPMVVLHSSGNTTPGLPNLVTSVTVDARVATQRRRLGR